MNILICTETYHPYTSGVVTHVETLKAALEAEGHRVLVAASVAGLKKQYEEDEVLYCPGKELKAIYGYGLATPYSLQRLEAVRRFGPDLVHIHTEFGMGLFGQWAARCLGVPTVYTVHTYYDDYVTYVAGKKTEAAAQRAMKKYVARFAGKANAVVAPAPKIAAYLAAAGYKGTPCIVPNTVQTASFVPNHTPAGAVARQKQALGIQPDDICLCFVGRLGGEKSVREAVAAFTAAFKGESHYKLFLLGDGPERQALADMVAAQGMQRQVFLLGKIPHEQLPLYYQCFSLYTTASLSEVHSISLIEAQVSGLYAINRLDEANRQQIVEGETGEYYTTPEQFEQLVRRYAALPTPARMAMRESISATARQYGPPQFAARIQEVYARALTGFYATPQKAAPAAGTAGQMYTPN